MNQTQLETIANEWALYKTAMHYARAMDQNRPDLIDGIFAEDAVIETPAFTLRGRAEIRAMPAQLKHKYVLTSHAVHNQTVEIDRDRAHGETNCLAHMMLAGPRGGEILIAEGVRYLDEWLCRDGRWQFTKRRVVIEFSEVRTARHIK